MCRFGSRNPSVGSVTTTLWKGLECPEHGGPPHIRIHEAAHAVIATHFDFIFERVEIYPNPYEHPMNDGFLAGGVFFESANRRKKITNANPRGMLVGR